MLSGADISSYQGNIDWNTFKNNINFCIIKSGEGNSLIDSWFGNNRQQARDTNILRGFYHFARPDLGNSPQAEARFFIDLMNGQPLQEGESVYLDYEVQYGGDNVNWVLSWMKLVEQVLQVKPIFYSYQSMLTKYDWTPVVNNGNGLWVATASGDPNNTNFKTGSWKFAMMNQWGSQVIPGIQGQTDSDIFFGDANAFRAYGYKTPPPSPPVDPCADIKNQLSNVEGTIDTLNKKVADLVSQNSTLELNVTKAQSDYNSCITDLSTTKEQLLNCQQNSSSTTPSPNLPPLDSATFRQLFSALLKKLFG